MAQPAAPRAGPDFTPTPLQPQRARPGLAAQPARAERTHRDELEDEPETGGGKRRFLRFLMLLLVLAGIGGGGWYAYTNQDRVMELIGSIATKVTASTGDAGRADAPVPKGLTGPPEALDAALQATPLWRIVKRDFPEWYAARLAEAAALAAQDKGEAAIGQSLTRSLVLLRRQHATHALAAGFAQLKSIATTFYENLAQLKKHSTEACFAFISQGEASPTVIGLMQNPVLARHLQAQLTAVFEAIAEGRGAARVYPQPRKSDYDALAADLTKRGWSQTDMQLFSDERALAGAGPEKVCQLVSDWFAAQLEIKDPDMQLRLLVDSLKPVVAG
jgi:hypothetical protein